MDKFWYDILNIGSNNQNESIISENIENIIDDYIKEINSFTSSLDCLCKVVSNNINIKLNELNYNSRIVNTNDIGLEYEHEFIVLDFKDESDNINYILIDPTYIQFLKQDNLKLVNFNNWPSDILNKTDKGKILLSNLINKGYSKIDNLDFKNYLESISNESSIDVCLDDLVLKNYKK